MAPSGITTFERYAALDATYTQFKQHAAQLAAPGQEDPVECFERYEHCYVDLYFKAYVWLKEIPKDSLEHAVIRTALKLLLKSLEKKHIDQTKPICKKFSATFDADSDSPITKKQIQNLRLLKVNTSRKSSKELNESLISERKLTNKLNSEMRVLKEKNLNELTKAQKNKKRESSLNRLKKKHIKNERQLEKTFAKGIEGIQEVTKVAIKWNDKKIKIIEQALNREISSEGEVARALCIWKTGKRYAVEKIAHRYFATDSDEDF